MKMNYYLYGSKNRNKLAKVLANTLFPEMKGDSAFFMVKNTPDAFKDYAGQPVLIWEDRGADLVGQLGGKDGITTVFDTKYRAGEYNGIPLNVVNIVTGDLMPQWFFHAIADEGVDGAHCFPIVAHVKADHYVTSLNTEYAKGGKPGVYQKVSTVKFEP